MYPVTLVIMGWPWDPCLIAAPSVPWLAFLEGVSDQTLVHSAITVGEENPRVFVKGPLELVDIAIVKAVDVQPDNPNDVLAIRSSYPLGRRKKSQLMNPQCSRRPNGTLPPTSRQ